jgi:serine palmitoyltransferase
MGTFSKSFSGMGGYIAASKEVIDYIKAESAGMLYHNSLSPVVVQQIITAFKVIMGEDGTDIGRQKLTQLMDNSNYFRSEMKKLGLHVYGDYNSPIIPVLIYFPSKIAAFSRECLARGLAVVVVGFPATSIALSRARFCISAGHTKEDLQRAVAIISEVADLLCLKYNNNFIGM